MAIKENDFINILKLIAPGTPIREGLEKYHRYITK